MPTTLDVGAVSVNGFDLGSLGLNIGRWPGFNALPSRRTQPTDLWGRDGGLLVSSEVRARAREVTLSGTLLAGTAALRRTAWDTIKARLDQGLLDVRFGDQPNRRLWAYATEADMRMAGAERYGTGGAVSISLSAPSPYLESLETEAVSFGATAVAVPIGTGPTTGYLQLFGATNPVITYRDAWGIAQGTMTFGATTLAAGEWLDVNLQTRGITKIVAGVRTNAYALMTAGDVPLLDARDSDQFTARGPSLDINSGTGLLLARRSWL